MRTWDQSFFSGSLPLAHRLAIPADHHIARLDVARLGLSEGQGPGAEGAEKLADELRLLKEAGSSATVGRPRIPYNLHMVVTDQIEGLLADLKTITKVAHSGVLSKHEVQLEPGETRLAAILFLDVVGFTALSKTLSPEQLATLIDRTFRIYELTVKGWGGYCDKVIGDAALYVFAGHPNYPPACEAALRAALKILERTRLVNESLQGTGLALAVRVGASFGEVTRQRVGGATQQVTVMGDTVNVAQRLQATAQPGCIQTTIRVLEKGGDVFQRRDAGEHELKGIGPVIAYEVTGIEPRAAELRGAFAGLTPFTGRETELAQALEQVLAWLRTKPQPREGEGGKAARPGTANRLLIVHGVTAVGKSRLAYELVERLKKRTSLATATVHCADNASLFSFTAELARVAELTRDNLVERFNALCAAAAHQVSPAYAKRQLRHLPLLALALGNESIDTSGVRQADTASFELGCKLAARACCVLAALEGKPVVLVVEDVQWAGPQRDLLKDLLQNLRLDAPLVMIATLRDAQEEDRAAEFIHQMGMPAEQEEADGAAVWRMIEVAPLSVTNVRALLGQLLPGLELPPGLQAELEEKAAGLPYYCEELARMLLRRGFVRATAMAAGGSERPQQRYELARELAGLEIPEDVQSLVLGRLDQLPERCKELAQRASVLGRSFELSLLQEMERQLGMLKAPAVRSAISALCKQRIFYRLDEKTLQFDHALTRDAAYSSLLSRNRQLLHGLAADALGGRIVHGTSSELQLLPERIKHLHGACRSAEEHKECCDLLLAMAQTGRMQDWERWEAQALSSLAAWMSRDAKVTMASSALLRAQAARQLKLGHRDEAKQLFTQAMAAAKQAGDCLYVARALSGLAILCNFAGEADQAMQYNLQALELARQCGDRRTEGSLLANIGLIVYDSGEAAEALEYYAQGLAIARETGNLRSEALCLLYMGSAHAEYGRNEEAFDCFNQVHAIALHVGDRGIESMALGNLGVTLHNKGDLKGAIEHYEQALALDREMGRTEGEGYNLLNLGDLSLLLGETAQARERYGLALELFRALGSQRELCAALAGLGQTLSLLGSLDEAKSAMDEAEAISAKLQDKMVQVNIECSWVYYLAARGDRKAAALRLARARQLTSEMGVGSDSQLGQDVARAEAALN